MIDNEELLKDKTNNVECYVDRKVIDEEELTPVEIAWCAWASWHEV